MCGRAATCTDDSNKCDIVTAETVEQLISEIGKIKTQMNSTELQLYEANEKIAELIENVCFVKINHRRFRFMEIVCLCTSNTYILCCFGFFSYSCS